jgi:uncharacterized phiE125 gp8 family phage protein
VNKVYTLVTGPESEPLEVGDAIAFLRASDDDAEYVSGLIAVAREMVENFTGRALLTQTWRMAADVWPTGDGMRWRTITLDRTPLASVTSVKYWPAGGSAQTTLSADMYTVQTGAEPGRLFLNYGEDWPDIEERPDAVEVNFTAGHTSCATVPATLRHATRLLVSHLYDQRAPLNIGNIVNELPFSLKHLLESQRVGGWVA